MKKADKAEMYEKIRKHGETLLKLFPEAKEKDPIKLCKSLRQYERKISAITLALCCEEKVDPDKADRDLDRIYLKVNEILNDGKRSDLPNFDPIEVNRVAFFINRDPRGYALKIHSEEERIREFGLYRDFGGYGILAPDFTPDDFRC